jgi:hypothetical protein
MRDLGLDALAHANRHAAYAGDNPSWPELSVLQAAHAAELLIKARIAQEHPLLIFEQLPRSTQALGAHLNLEDLFSLGRTIQWSDLPERLWASTGIPIPKKTRFDSFGRIRNGIQHFGPPLGRDSSEETLRFVFEVLDPFINKCWRLFAVDYDEDNVAYEYFVGAMISREITFLVSRPAAEAYNGWSVDWSSVSETYRDEMQARVKKALVKRGHKH